MIAEKYIYLYPLRLIRDMALKRFFRFAHLCTQKRRFVCPSIQNSFTHYLCISLPQAFDDYVGSPERGG